MSSITACIANIASFDRASLAHTETKEIDLCTFLGIKKPNFICVDENSMGTMYAHSHPTGTAPASAGGVTADDDRYLQAPSQHRHGHLFPDQAAIGPVLANWCDEDARPGVGSGYDHLTHPHVQP